MFLQVSDLRKSFGPLEVLRGVGFSMRQGQVLSVIGSSGSGKTTLLRCLNFLEMADGGSITLNGKQLYDGANIVAASDAVLRRNRLHFGLVFQQFNLFPQYTALRNITLAPELLYLPELPKADRAGRKAEIEQESRELLSRVRLSDKESAYPYQLSGGQQQRVAIARALALRPDILCFDEPTSALDPELTGEVLRVIRGLKSASTTMIIVTHEMQFARDVSDHVLFMADGVIEEQGSPDEVFGSPRRAKTRAFLQMG